MSWEIRQGDALERLGEMPDESVQCCVTSPPYWGLRDYGVDGQLGLEETPEQFVAALTGVFAEVRRVLRDDGTLWLNLGDTMQKGQYIGLPWRLVFALRNGALRNGGWILRQEIIWHKRNGLPDGSATDRPDRFHEQIFLLTKQRRYYYDAEAVREDSDPEQEEHNRKYAREYEAHTDHAATTGQPGNVNNSGIHARPGPGGRNLRSVWRESVAAFPGAHFATFPPKLIEPCILAGSAEGDVILDPFAGAATTGLVATRLDRSFVGIELNPEYVELGRNRIRDDAPLLNHGAEVAA